jgi:hypothetical protein
MFLLLDLQVQTVLKEYLAKLDQQDHKASKEFRVKLESKDQ